MATYQVFTMPLATSSTNATPTYDATTGAPVKLDGSEAAIATDFYSAAYVGNASAISIAIDVPATGTPVGTITLEGSDDPAGGLHGGAEVPDEKVVLWHALKPYDEAAGALASSFAISSATQFLISLQVCTVQFIRIKYARSSGSITPTIRLKSKGTGR